MYVKIEVTEKDLNYFKELQESEQFNKKSFPFISPHPDLHALMFNKNVNNIKINTDDEEVLKAVEKKLGLNTFYVFFPIDNSEEEYNLETLSKALTNSIEEEKKKGVYVFPSASLHIFSNLNEGKKLIKEIFISHNKEEKYFHFLILEVEAVCNKMAYETWKKNTHLETDRIKKIHPYSFAVTKESILESNEEVYDLSILREKREEKKLKN